MSRERVAELRALCDAATPGPWLQSAEASDIVAAEDSIYGLGVADCNCKHLNGEYTPDEGIANAALISAVRTALPEALDAIESGWAHVAFRLEQLDLAHQLQGELETKLAATQAALDGALGQLASMRAALGKVKRFVELTYPEAECDDEGGVLWNMANNAIAQPPSAQERLIAAELALAQAYVKDWLSIDGGDVPHVAVRAETAALIQLRAELAVEGK